VAGKKYARRAIDFVVCTEIALARAAFETGDRYTKLAILAFSLKGKAQSVKKHDRSIIFGIHNMLLALKVQSST
jgi:hypothetical protein